MSALANRRFLKMHGAGNAIVVLDLRGTNVRVRPGRRAPSPPTRLGLRPADGAARSRSRGTDAFMRIYNTDGSESGACGNGTRCVAYAMLDDPAMARPVETGRLVLETVAGRVEVQRVAERSFTVDMGRPGSPGTRSPCASPSPTRAGSSCRSGRSTIRSCTRRAP